MAHEPRLNAGPLWKRGDQRAAARAVSVAFSTCCGRSRCRRSVERRWRATHDRGNSGLLHIELVGHLRSHVEHAACAIRSAILDPYRRRFCHSSGWSPSQWTRDRVCTAGRRLSKPGGRREPLRKHKAHERR